ncbi:unnamed protein product [Pedinophyceae sp. YPF-701]|nr:unnamed protein product [Pedinophyceae sp. YPF-701]
MGFVQSPAGVLGVAFNQDASFFVVALEKGFRVYNAESPVDSMRREDGQGIAQVEMLFRCNIFALVGGGADPQYSPSKVMIWDDHQGSCIGELSFRSPVRRVCLRRDRVAVALEHKALVYNFADLRLLHQIETIDNAEGLLALSAGASTVLACPGLHKGQVRLELYDLRRTRFVRAHDSGLQKIALSADGSRLATASERGTLVRIFNTADGAPLQELRRGADAATIFSIAFSPDGTKLAATSDRGTVHVFGLRDGAVAPDGAASDSSSGAAPGTKNRTLGTAHKALGVISGFLPRYFNSEWSALHFRLPQAEAVRPSVVAFAPSSDAVYVVTHSGAYLRVELDEANQQCVQRAYVKYLEIGER